MARKTTTGRRKAKTRPSGDAPLARWWRGMSPEGRRNIVGRTLGGLLAVAIVAGGCLALRHMRQYVLAQPAYADSAAEVALAEQPAWMSDWLAEQILLELRGGPDQANATFDDDLAERIHAAAARCPWVKQLRSVRVERIQTDAAGDPAYAAGRVVVDAAWRRPFVKVWDDRTGWDEYLDNEGVVLPRLQAERQVALYGKRYPRIVGQTSPAPPPGHLWRGEDVAAGLAMLKLLWDRPYCAEITEINVANYDLRNRTEPAILLLAAVGRQATRIKFGQLPLGDMPPLGEPSTRHKLAALDQLYKIHGGRLAGTEPYYDLRFRRPLIPTDRDGSTF